MTIKINVGVNKKIGLPDYGSAGSHCNIEIESDNSILDNAEHFMQRVKNAYEVARMSVEEELSHHRTTGTSTANTRAEPQQQRQEQRQEYRQDYRSNDSGGYYGGGNTGANRIASAKQQQFIASLVKAVKGLDWKTLDQYCNSKWGHNTSQLSPKQASELIDDLQAAKAGRGEIAA